MASQMITEIVNETEMVPATTRATLSDYVHGAMGRRIDPSWSGPIELFLVPASAPRLV